MDTKKSLEETKSLPPIIEPHPRSIEEILEDERREKEKYAPTPRNEDGIEIS